MRRMPFAVLATGLLAASAAHANRICQSPAHSALSAQPPTSSTLFDCGDELGIRTLVQLADAGWLPVQLTPISVASNDPMTPLVADQLLLRRETRIFRDGF